MSERKSENIVLIKEAGVMARYMLEITRDNKLNWKDLADMEGLISVTDLYRGNILDGTKNELMSIIGDVFKKWYSVDNEGDYNLVNKLSWEILPAYSILYEKYWEFSVRVIDKDIYIYNLGTLQQIITSSGGTKSIDSEEWARYSKINNWNNNEINLVWMARKLSAQEEQLLNQEKSRLLDLAKQDQARLVDSPLEINSENFESIKEVLIFLFNPNNPKDYPETYGALHKKLQVSVFNFIQEYKRQHPKLALSGSVESPSDISWFARGSISDRVIMISIFDRNRYPVQSLHETNAWIEGRDIFVLNNLIRD